MPSPAQESVHEGPERNARGLLAIGPKDVSFSDVLAKLIDEAKGDKTRDQFGFSSPDELYKAEKLTRGRRLYSAREAERQRREAVIR